MVQRVQVVASICHSLLPLLPLILSRMLLSIYLSVYFSLCSSPISSFMVKILTAQWRKIMATREQWSGCCACQKSLLSRFFPHRLVAVCYSQHQARQYRVIAKDNSILFV